MGQQRQRNRQSVRRRWSFADLKRSNVRSPAGMPALPVRRSRSQRFAGQSLVSFEVLGLALRYYVGRQHGSGRRFVPIEGFEVITDELFVETRLAFARLILVRGPETGGIGSKEFINQNKFAVEQAEFE